MNLPTKDQVYAAARNIGSYGSGIVTCFVALKLMSAGDAQVAMDALNQIGDGAAKIAAGVSALIPIGFAALAAISANPLVQLFKGVKQVATDPVALETAKKATIEEQAALATVTDKMPTVVAVPLAPTIEGRMVENMTPSSTVVVAKPTVNGVLVEGAKV